MLGAFYVPYERACYLSTGCIYKTRFLIGSISKAG